METPREPKITEAQDGPSQRQATTITPIKRMPPRVCGALVLLLESYDYAKDLGESPWEFAVEQYSLRELGLTNSDVAWLVGKKLVDHARDDGTWRPATVVSPLRSFGTVSQNMLHIERTGPRLRPRDRSPRAAPPCAHGSGRAPSENAPIRLVEWHAPSTWDRDRLELRVDDQIVKQFKVPAANQETILAAFQEEGWPPRIDDPLPPQPEQDSKRRLHDTINSLNRNQKRALLRFFLETAVAREFAGNWVQISRAATTANPSLTTPAPQ